MEINLEKLWVTGEEDSDGAREFDIQTDAGVIHSMYHEAPLSTAAVIWMFGSGGGLDGPAGGMYKRLAKQLISHDIGSLRVDYRQPGDIESVSYTHLTLPTILRV